jgi:tRNA uridine 5-carboxymethylaminomethyl modification enzyme
MLTARAEFRLLLREDNAVDRLLPIARGLGLCDDVRWAAYEGWQRELAAVRDRAHAATFTGTDAVNAALARHGSAPLVGRRATLAELYRRPELSWQAIDEIAAAADLAPRPSGPASDAAAERVAIELGYDGYLKRQEADAARMAKADAVMIPPELELDQVHGLSREVREKLAAVGPRSVGQASRIPGVTPAAIAILLTHIGLFHRRRREVGSAPS